MKTPIQLDDLNGLIDELETQITEVHLPRQQEASVVSILELCNG